MDMTYMNECIHDMFAMNTDLLAFYLFFRDCDDNWIWCRESDSNCFIV